MSKDKKASKQKSQKGQINKIVIALKFLSFATGIIILLISKYSFMFFVFGMLPAIIAMLSDRSVNHYASSTIIAFNLVGVLPFIFQIFASQNIDSTAQYIVSSINTWGIVYATTSIGWVLLWFLPILASRIFYAKAQMRIRKIEKQQKEQVDEWGSEVRLYMIQQSSKDL